MSENLLPLDVIGAQFAMLDPARQRDTAFLCLSTLVGQMLERDADRVSVAEFDHLRCAVSTFEEGLYRRCIQQLEMAQAMAIRTRSGGCFAPVGQRNARRIAMLKRRLDLIRIVTPVTPPQALAS